MMEPILRQLRRATEASGWGRSALARELGITPGHVTKFLDGERGLSVEVAERLAAILKMEIMLRPKRQRKGR